MDATDNLKRNMQLSLSIREVEKIADQLRLAQRLGEFGSLREIAGYLREAASGLDKLDELVFGKKDLTQP